MERKYFTWESWDEIDSLALNFYNCTVVTPFGPFQVGDKLDYVYLNFGDGAFECIHDSGEILFSGKFELSIKE